MIALMLTATLLSIAQAATVTEIPPFLRGDVELAYGYDRLGGSLQERGEPGEAAVVVGSRRVETHQMRYGAVFGAGPGVAIFVSVPHDVWSGVTYDAWSKMVYAPATGSGTYVGANAQEASTPVVGNGVAGVWLGVRGTPFSEAFKLRSNRVTWLLEGGVRTPSEQNRWTVVTTNDTGLPGERGAGNGGVALRLHNVFSTTHGISSPYLSMTWTAEQPTTVTVTDDAGTVLASDVTVDPGDSFRARAGIELMAANNPANGSSFAFDLHLGAEYTSFGVVPTAYYLPGVLVPEAGTTQTAESLEGGAGLGMIWRPMKYMQLNLHGDVSAHLPQRVESSYSVYTGGDTIRVVTGLDLTVRVR